MKKKHILLTHSHVSINKLYMCTIIEVFEKKYISTVFNSDVTPSVIKTDLI